MKTIKVALAGAGAFGIKHLDGIHHIEGVEVVSLVSRELDKTREVAAKYGIAHVTTELADSLALSLHEAFQGTRCGRCGTNARSSAQNVSLRPRPS